MMEEEEPRSQEDVVMDETTTTTVEAPPPEEAAKPAEEEEDEEEPPVPDEQERDDAPEAVDAELPVREDADADADERHNLKIGADASSPPSENHVQNGPADESDVCEPSDKVDMMDVERDEGPSAEEASKIRDPFDDLLLDGDKNDQSDTSVAAAAVNESDLTEEDPPHVADDTLCEDPDLTVSQGADEEVCLLPDTEREISEADKLKALAVKNSIKPETVTNSFDLLKESGVISNLKNEISCDDGIINNDLLIERGTEEEIEDDNINNLPDTEQDKDDEEHTEHTAEESIEHGIIRELCETVDHACLVCSEIADCVYRLLVDNDAKYICSIACVNKFTEENPDQYVLSHRKATISEVLPVENTCFNCNAVGSCYYRFLCGAEVKYLCQEKCLYAVINVNMEKYKVRRKKKIITEVIGEEGEAPCYGCTQTKRYEYEFMLDGGTSYLCSSACLSQLQKAQPYTFNIKKKKVVQTKQPLLAKLKLLTNSTADKYLDSSKIVAKTAEEASIARTEREKSFNRQCAHCNEPYTGSDKSLSWETMDFCNEICLGKYQNVHGLHCANCKNAVSMVSLGKYCVRFGYDIRQFCCSTCLDDFKKGLKICCYCQRDISSGYEGFLAPVGDQGQFKDFCSQFCVEKFDQMSKNPIPPPVWARCAVCSLEKLTEVEVEIEEKPLRLCSEPCFAAFKFVNKIVPDQCRWCKKYFERKSSESYTIYTEGSVHCFCSKTCMNVYISNSRHIVPCNWCKVKKYNFDMITKTQDSGQAMMMCSLNCLTLYQVSVNAVSSRRIKCDQCKHVSQAQYHLTMSDATVRDFCSYQCVMSFQSQYGKTPMALDGNNHAKHAVPTGAPRRTYNNVKSTTKNTSKKSVGRPAGLPVISSVKSLAPPTSSSSASQSLGHATRAKSKRHSEKSSSPPPDDDSTKVSSPPPPPQPQIYNHVVLKPPPPKDVRNMATMAKPLTVTKGVLCKPHMCTKEVQTDDFLQRRIFVPVPVPIYVPTPMAMYSLPFPVPVPFPLPIPVPVFIPTTRNSANGIMKEIKKIHEKMPTDPFEAELLMMAEMVAGDKKKCESDSESEEENGDDGFSADGMDTANPAFGEDVLQMALKMATEYEEPAVDLESAMTASTITPSSHPSMPGLDENNPMHHHHQLLLLEHQRAATAAATAANAANRKRSVQNTGMSASTRSKRSRRAPDPPPPTHHPPPEPPREPQEKPDANMCLKYTFGVNAWKQWVMTKNAEMEKSSVRRKPFKSEILQLTADELNYSLCLFVKEVRKPNGSEYAPDTIYYLVLGIQQYLFENGRIDNIFTDTYYEKFTECLDEVARKFSVLYNDSQYIVTRVEEEHLWESKQLGAHSPHVLLSTLMFFNTKHFNLVTVEEHMQLSFSHIMKHWKRNPNQPGAAKIPGARNVLLRFYPPQSALEANSRKKKVYEQQENEENPLRCPVKLYEFYISKCPESVKTRNDVFYLMPERSCVPDSPVWYSTQALGREPLSKMLHRVKMVKEINIALLTS